MIVWKLRKRFYNLGRNRTCPPKHTIKGWINKFEETGSVQKRKQQDDQEVLVVHRTLMVYASLSYGVHGVQ